MKNKLTLGTQQTRYHYTRFDQEDRLVGAGESDPEIAFMGRLLALCSLPRTNPGQRLQYKRVSGPYQLYMIAGGGNKLPYGNIPRLLLAWVCTEAVPTQSRDLILGKRLSDFMRVLGIDPGGASFARVRNQMKRLFGCSITWIYEAKSGFTQVNSYVADKHEFWWAERNSGDPGVFNGSIRMGEEFFNEIIAHPIPLDIHVLKAALEFLRKRMRRYGRPNAIVIDRLRSYRAALRELGGSGLHQAGRC